MLPPLTIFSADCNFRLVCSRWLSFQENDCYGCANTKLRSTLKKADLGFGKNEQVNTINQTKYNQSHPFSLTVKYLFLYNIP